MQVGRQIKVELLKVRVKPRSSQRKIEWDGEQFVVWLHSPPEDGKANSELVTLFRKERGEQVEIVKGFTSRTKYLRRV